ncbi:hypothetical protein [Desulfogranum marinum]|uniref:hypothetical protein n=1 Tax=Desulfogranum marinum TaxID=453220 RepID=UPI0029C9AFF1|nr:hypothetical protein [Desulfogranum marinum]
MKHHFQLLTTSLVFLLCCFFATALTAEAETDSKHDDWKFGGAAYLWAAGVKGTSMAGDEIDVSFSDVLGDLDGGLMGILSAQKGKWTLLANIIYLSIHQETSSNANFVGVPTKFDIDAKMKGYISTFGVAYRAVDKDLASLDLLVGARYFKLDLDLDAEIAGSMTKYSDSEDVLDGIIGAQVLFDLSDRWYFSLYADVGVGDSKLTWQVWPGVGYRLDKVELVAGYRHLAWETDEGDTIEDINFSGPMFGIKFRF